MTALSPTPPPPALTNPRLSANLRGDYEALQNDVEQARLLAAEFQCQLAGKSNEVAHLKQVFEKTSRDLAHLQEGITALREERHRLANEAMRAIALEHRLARMEAEHGRVQAELEKATRREHEREPQISQLTAEMEKLRRELSAAEARLVLVPAPPPRAGNWNPEAQAHLTAATESLARLREALQESGVACPARPVAECAPAKQEFIAISFAP